MGSACLSLPIFEGVIGFPAYPEEVILFQRPVPVIGFRLFRNRANMNWSLNGSRISDVIVLVTKKRKKPALYRCANTRIRTGPPLLRTIGVRWWIYLGNSLYKEDPPPQL